MNICFVTSWFGHRRRDRPFKKFPKCSKYDYYLVTDNQCKTSWDIIDSIPNEIQKMQDNVRKSRYAKFMFWDLLEKINKEYDFVFYCDSYFYPKTEVDWHKMANETIKKKFPLIQSEHPYEKVRNGGVMSEMQFALSKKRDSKENIEKTKYFFNKYDPTIKLDYPQCYMNGFLGYDPKNNYIRDFTSNFWNIYINEDISYRDQYLWNFLLLHEKQKPFPKYNLGEKFVKKKTTNPFLKL